MDGALTPKIVQSSWAEKGIFTVASLFSNAQNWPDPRSGHVSVFPPNSPTVKTGATLSKTFMNWV